MCSNLGSFVKEQAGGEEAEQRCSSQAPLLPLDPGTRWLSGCVGANPSGGRTGWGPLVHPQVDGKGWDPAGRAKEGLFGRAVS